MSKFGPLFSHSSSNVNTRLNVYAVFYSIYAPFTPLKLVAGPNNIFNGPQLTSIGHNMVIIRLPTILNL